MTDDERRYMISAAYHVALAARHGSASVNLLVSQDAWDYLMSFRQPKSPSDWSGFTFVGMEWLDSITIVCDTSSSQPEGFSIVVETRQVIA